MSDTWIALRRPLCCAFVIGCAVSLAATGRLILTLILGSTFAWAFIPAFEALGFAIVTRRDDRLPFSRRLDRFFIGRGPWAAFAVLVGGVASFVPPWQLNVHLRLVTGLLLAVAVVTAVRSWSIDVDFYRRELGRSDRETIRDAAVQRAISWGASVVYFFGYVGWPLVVDMWPR